MRANAKSAVEKISLERIYRLFELAGTELEKHPERSKRYIELSRRIGTRNRVRIPLELKYQYCKKCGSFLKPGKNAVVTKTSQWTEIRCNECNHSVKHRPLPIQ